MAWAWPPVVDDITAIGVTPSSYQASSRSLTSPGLPLIVQSSTHASVIRLGSLSRSPAAMASSMAAISSSYPAAFQ